MTDSVEGARRRFADELRAAHRLGSDALVEALARVPRERFLAPGPWMVRGERDREPRATENADPRHVYQNVSIAVDATRDLYNGQPGLVAGWLDSLAIRPNDRVLHIGCATGYYSALMAELTGPGGQVTAIEVDADLAARARDALTPWPWVTARQGDGRTHLPLGIDVLLVHAGATHVLDEWLDVVRDGGRLLVPLTCTIPGMPASLSKGMILTATRQDTEWMARVGSMVMIYALVGARDEAMNARLGQALMGGKWASVARLRRDPHESGATCWLHGSNCLATA
ncbi:MAG TPA: methyltransferase domain-containing protein [Vicinamibacterales bacterium]|nr:methyltransferase domain-containing protein [Vicinamibacterales bacterium]